MPGQADCTLQWTVQPTAPAIHGADLAPAASTASAVDGLERVPSEETSPHATALNSEGGGAPTRDRVGDGASRRLLPRLAHEHAELLAAAMENERRATAAAADAAALAASAVAAAAATRAAATGAAAAPATTTAVAREPHADADGSSLPPPLTLAEVVLVGSTSEQHKVRMGQGTRGLGCIMR